MSDRWIVTFKTPRGNFRIWDNYRDRSLELARELKKLGVDGVELYAGFFNG